MIEILKISKVTSGLSFVNILSIIANIATITGMFSLVYAICSDYKKNKKENKGTSIMIITKYKNKILPKIKEMNKEVETEFKNVSIQLTQQYKDNNKNDLNNVLIKMKLDLKLKYGLGNIVNDVDALAININNDMCDKELLEKDIGKSLKEFCVENANYIHEVNEQNDGIYNEIEYLINTYFYKMGA